MSRSTQMGRSARALDWNAAHFGEPKGRSESADQFLAAWARIRTQYAASTDEGEKAGLAEMLFAAQDFFDRMQS